MSRIAHRDLGVDQPDSTVAPDEDDTRASRILFHDKKSEDQRLLAPETSIPGTVVDNDKHGNRPTSECS